MSIYAVKLFIVSEIVSIMAIMLWPLFWIDKYKIRLPLPPSPLLSLFVLCEYVVYVFLLMRLTLSKCLLEKELIARNYSFQKSLVMRIRIAYKVNGKDTLEEGQISNFPKGLWSQKYGRVIKVIYKTHCFCLHSTIPVQFSCLIPSNEEGMVKANGIHFLTQIWSLFAGFTYLLYFPPFI